MRHRDVIEHDRIGLFVGTQFGVFERFHEIGKPAEIVHLHLRSVDGQRVVDRGQRPIILRCEGQITCPAVIEFYGIVHFARQYVSGVDQAVQTGFVVSHSSEGAQAAGGSDHFFEVPLSALGSGIFDQRIDVRVGWRRHTVTDNREDSEKYQIPEICHIAKIESFCVERMDAA